MLTKEKIIEVLETFPSNQEIDIDALIQKIFILKDIDDSENDIKNGNTFTHDEVLKEIESWQK